MKAYHCDDEKKRKRYIERMKQLGVEYTGGIQFWPERVSSLKHVKESVNTKMGKLKSRNYEGFPSYELFIFTDTWMHENILKEMEKFLTDSNVFKYFNRVYVFEQGSNLHIFEENNYQRVVIDMTEQSERDLRARRMVEQAEDQE